MAFPVNGILDNFNRPDSTTTVGGSWTAFTAVGGSSGNEGLLGSNLYNPKTGFSNYTGMYWNPSTFGPDCEVYMSMPTVYTANSGDCPSVYTRISNFTGNGTYDSYEVQAKRDNNSVNIQKHTGTITTTLGTFSQTIASGDKFGMSCVGTIITAYYFPTGGTGWVNVGTLGDSSISAAGNIGWYIPGNTQDGRFDDFGGGSLVSASGIKGYRALLGIGL